MREAAIEIEKLRASLKSEYLRGIDAASDAFHALNAFDVPATQRERGE